MNKSLTYKAEIEGIGEMIISYTASHSIIDGDSHEDATPSKVDSFGVVSIDNVEWVIDGNIQEYYKYPKGLVQKLETLLSENPELFFEG